MGTASHSPVQRACHPPAQPVPRPQVACIDSTARGSITPLPWARVEMWSASTVCTGAALTDPVPEEIFSLYRGWGVVVASSSGRGKARGKGVGTGSKESSKLSEHARSVQRYTNADSAHWCCPSLRSTGRAEAIAARDRYTVPESDFTMDPAKLSTSLKS